MLARADYLFGRDGYGRNVLQACNPRALRQLEELDDWVGWQRLERQGECNVEAIRASKGLTDSGGWIWSSADTIVLTERMVDGFCDYLERHGFIVNYRDECD